MISLNGETTVPADVIKAIADSRIKAEFIIDSINSWIIDGAAIKSASAADFTVLPRKLRQDRAARSFRR